MKRNRRRNASRNNHNRGRDNTLGTMKCTQACVKLSLRTVKFALCASEIADEPQLRKIRIFHMSFWGNEVTVRIKRSECAYAGFHADAMNDICKNLIINNPNNVWISSCNNARFHHKVISSPQAISFRWWRGKLQIKYIAGGSPAHQKKIFA